MSQNINIKMPLANNLPSSWLILQMCLSVVSQTLVDISFFRIHRGHFLTVSEFSLYTSSQAGKRVCSLVMLYMRMYLYVRHESNLSLPILDIYFYPFRNRGFLEHTLKDLTLIFSVSYPEVSLLQHVRQ